MQSSVYLAFNLSGNGSGNLTRLRELEYGWNSTGNCNRKWKSSEG